VAIVSFDVREHLRACLDSVLAEGPAEVVVVDNASTDGTVAMLERDYPGVSLRPNPTNVGYGAAANQAINLCKNEYVLLLNSDTIVRPGALAALAAYMDRHPEAAAVGPLLRYPNGSLQPSYFPFPGTLAWLLENEPVLWLLRRLPVGRPRLLCLTPPTEDRVVPWLLGAALLLRRTAFDAVGGFDESYFMYFEEVDLCLRLRAREHRVHFTPSATVLHVSGASTSQHPIEMAIAHFQSCQRFYRRHYSRGRAWAWISFMKLKMLYRLARDLACLGLASAETRPALRRWIRAWSTNLRGLAPHPAPLVQRDSRGETNGHAHGAGVHPRPQDLRLSVAGARPEPEGP
jgi:GT2 family glycosyltransferase